MKQNQGFLLVPYSAKDYSSIIGKKYTAQIQNLVKQNKGILGDPGVKKTEKYHNFLKVQMQWLHKSIPFSQFAPFSPFANE